MVSIRIAPHTGSEQFVTHLRPSARRPTADQATTGIRAPAHWGDTRPSDRAGPPHVALLSVHTSPLDQPGAGDSGGMNVYLDALSRHLAHAGANVEVFTRAAGDAAGSLQID